MPLTIPASIEEFVYAQSKRLAKIWSITPQVAPALYFCDHDKAIDFEGERYSPAGGFDATAERLEGALRDHNRSLKGMVTSDRITIEDLMAGVYDEAEVIERVVDWQYPFAGAFFGRKYWIDKINFDGEVAEAEMSGPTRRLKQKVGEVHNRTCAYRVGVVDPITGIGCTVDLALHTISAVPALGTLDSQKRMIILCDPASFGGGEVDGQFDDGEVVFLTGANAGHRRDIKRFTIADHRIELQSLLPFPVSAGDTFDLVRGCDGRKSTCKSPFNNIDEFTGDPFMPFTDRVLTVPQT